MIIPSSFDLMMHIKCVYRARLTATITEVASQHQHPYSRLLYRTVTCTHAMPTPLSFFTT
jgi:hypothetical protein